MPAFRTSARCAFTLLLAALLAVGAACTGEGGDTEAIPGPDTPDVSPDTPEPPQAECDPTAEPTGCPDGALCWYGRCAAVAEQSVAAEGQTVIAAVASLADDKAGAIVAWTERAAGPTPREDRLLVAFLNGDQLGPATEVDRWTVAPPATGTAEPASPRLVLARSPGGAVALVRGPEPLVAYRMNGATWEPTESLETGARLVTSEGSLAAAWDGADRLHVAFHDTQTDWLDVATLSAEGAWTHTPVYDLAAHFDRPTWGARVTGTTLGGGTAFALVLESEDQPRVKRGAIIADLNGNAWDVSTPALAEGLVLEGRIVGLAATADPDDRLTLGWLPYTRQIGVAVRGEDGRWTQQQLPDVSRVNVSDALHDNLAIRWWQDALVYAWLGEPVSECACFDIRLAMVRDGQWIEHRVRRLPDRLAGDLDLAIDDEGRLLLPVGGGPFTDRGTAEAILFTSRLPDWTTP